MDNDNTQTILWKIVEPVQWSWEKKNGKKDMVQAVTVSSSAKRKLHPNILAGVGRKKLIERAQATPGEIYMGSKEGAEALYDCTILWKWKDTHAHQHQC